MSKKNRNVLLITWDQWRADCLSALEHPCVKTPSCDALIKDGIAFKNHYSVCAPCGPARASLLTGMYMQNHRSVRNGTPLDNRHTNIAREVRRAGYTPVLFGYTDTSLDPRVYSEEQILRLGYEGVLPDFEEGVMVNEEDPGAWLEYLQNKGYTVTAENVYQPVDNYPGSESRGRTFSPPCYGVEDCQTAFLTRKVIEYLETVNDDWFVHLSYLRPHPPFIAPEPYNRMYDPEEVPMPVRPDKEIRNSGTQHPWLQNALKPEGEWYYPWMQSLIGADDYDKEIRQTRATYYGLITKLDDYLGKLIDFLKRSGHYDNTLIILMSDHGELLGDQWLFGKRGYFDSGFKNPLIVRVPGRDTTQRGRWYDQFSESIDILPTILDWLELDVPRQCDGRSLLPFSLGEIPADWRTEVHWEHDFRNVTDDGLEREMNIKMDECQMNVVRNNRYKYVHFTNLPPLFFDLENDPCETKNLASDVDYAPLVLEMSQKMLSWRMQNDERTLTGIKVTREGIFSRE